MTKTETFRSLLAFTLTVIDREFHGWEFTAEDFAGETLSDLFEFCYRHHCPTVQNLPATFMV